MPQVTHKPAGREQGCSPDDASAVLNLGAGRKRLHGAINVDIVTDTNPDIVHDLNVLPWPLATSRFDRAHGYDVLEHLENVTRIIEEIHRVCRDGARVFITVPHFSCSNAFTDPTHRHYFGYFSLDYYTGQHEFSFYTQVRFRCRTRSIMFYPTLLNKFVSRLANRFPEIYERRWAWMFPAWFLYFELEVLKADTGVRAASN
jgi:SAM-dependent methyltransferase